MVSVAEMLPTIQLLAFKLEGLMSELTKNCPFCAEEIKEAATVCKHCGRELGGPRVQATAEPAKKKRSIWTYLLLGGGALAGICICFFVFTGALGASSIDSDSGATDSGEVSGNDEPAATATPLPVAPDYDTFWDNSERMSDAQWEVWSEGIEDTQVAEWSGTVFQVDKGEILGGYTVLVDMEPGGFGSEIHIDVEEDVALAVNLDSTITFSGRIRSADNSLGLVIFIEDAEITTE